VEPTQELILRLKKDLEDVKSQLQASEERQNRVHAELAEKNLWLEQLQQSQPQVLSQTSPFSVVSPHRTTEDQISFMSPSSFVREPHQQFGPIIAHIGRLVKDRRGTEYFVGSPIGIHFVLSVQHQFQKTFGSNVGFPEWIFRLHLLSSLDGNGRFSPRAEEEALFPDIQYSITDYLRGLDRPHQHYYAQVETYLQTWAPLYPILSTSHFYDTLNHLLEDFPPGTPLQEPDLPLIFQLYAILALNDVDRRNQEPSGSMTGAIDQPSGARYHIYLKQLFCRVAAQGNLLSLQGLLLYLLYLQLTGQHSLAIQVNGMVVKLAQSLGLHRHSKRFKHLPSEMELRKRIWWCVYILDV
jgi:hypothetical protein